MNDDRTAQARAEAERRWPLYSEDDQDDRDHTNAMRFIFMQGVEWADAHPAPHTITEAKADAQTALLDRLEALANGFHHAGDLSAEKSLRGWIEDARERIEVTDQ